MSAARAEVIDRVIAIVNGHLITLSDVSRVVELGLANTGRITDATDVVLSQLIDRRLVLDEVERYAPPEPAQAAIAERMIAIQQQLSGPPGLEERSRGPGRGSVVARAVGPRRSPYSGVHRAAILGRDGGDGRRDRELFCANTPATSSETASRSRLARPRRLRASG